MKSATADFVYYWKARNWENTEKSRKWKGVDQGDLVNLRCKLLFLKGQLSLKVPLRRKFVGLFPPNSVAEYRLVSIFTQKTEQKTVHPNIF